MRELVRLGEHYDELRAGGISIVAASTDSLKTAASRARGLGLPFPVVSDAKERLLNSLDLRHEKAAPDRSDVFYASQFLVDDTGTVRWKFTPDNVGVRSTPAEILAAVKQL